MVSADLAVGALVEYQGVRGVVRFFGVTEFQAKGQWAGIELFEAKGKNDGSVAGVSYFKCKPGYGVFVRLSQISVINPEADPRNGSRVPATTPGRGSMGPPAPVTLGRLGHQRTGSMAGSRTLSASTSTRSTPPASRSQTPPTRPSPGSTPTASVSRTSTSPVKRTSTLLQQSATQRQRENGRAPPSPVTPFPVRRTTSPAPINDISRLQTPPPASPVKPQSPVNLTNALAEDALEDPPASPAAATASISPEELALLREEEQMLRKQLAETDGQVADQRQRIRELEVRLADAQQFVALKPKLQAKLTSLQADLNETRRTLADQNDLNALTESKLIESTEQLEMAMLDKEMADERAEAAEAESESVKEQLAVLEVELNVLRTEMERREGGGEGGGGGGEGEGVAEANDAARKSLAYIQLERHNERMKEALVRLRDISHEAEIESRRKIQELERDLASLDDIQSQYENALSKLENSEVHIEELKAQVDYASGAEDMLLELTEKNLEMSEKLAEMQIIIEDYEQLKEISDELEESHQETEKELQEEIERKDTSNRDRARKIEILEEALQDADQTILNFRDLVMQQQSEIELLRTQHETVQTESQAQASQSAAIMSRNVKLQLSALKNQAKAIDLELRRIEAQEGRDLLEIVQPYLPQIYIESDSDATNTYLFFKRIAAKADLINSTVGQIHGLPDSLNGPITENLAMVCEMRGRICHMSTLAKRFAAVLRRCDVASFLNIGRIYAEMTPMEKRIDMHIDLLRRDEFREMECVSDVHKIAAQFDHLADLYFVNFQHDLAERELNLAAALDADLDMFSAAIGLTRTAINAHLKEEDTQMQCDDLDADETLFKPLQALQEQTKSAKLLSRKLVKRLEDLMFDSNALRPHLLPTINSLTTLITKCVDFGVQLSQKVSGLLGEQRANKTPLKLTAILALVRELAMSAGTLEGPSPWQVLDDVVKQLVTELGAVMPQAMESENVVKITGISPWVVRVDEIKTAAAVNVEAERKAVQMSEELQELARQIRKQEQTEQESKVKIELMERRLESVKRQGDTIVELEADLAKARKQEKIYQDAMDQLQSDYDQLEQDMVKVKQAVPAERQPSGTQQAEGETLAVETNLETSHLLEQIDSLRGTVRFLRHENSYLKGQDLLREIAALPELPSYTPPPLTPPDSPTSSASSSDPSTPPTSLRSLALETKTLYRDVIAFSSTPKMVDLSALNKRKLESSGNGKASGWMPAKQTPAHQLLERKRAVDELQRKVRALKERTDVVVPRA